MDGELFSACTSRRSLGRSSSSSPVRALVAESILHELTDLAAPAEPVVLFVSIYLSVLYGVL